MAVGGSTYSSDDIVVKSPNDRRLYRYIQLPNGLCALLVHDPDIYMDGPPESARPDEISDDDADEEDDEDDEDESGEEEDDGEDDDEDDDEGNEGKKIS